METWRHGDGDIETWRQWDIKQRTANGSPGYFPKFVYRLLFMQMEVCRLSICWQRNKWKLSICKRTKRTCPPMRKSYCIMFERYPWFVSYSVIDKSWAIISFYTLTRFSCLSFTLQGFGEFGEGSPRSILNPVQLKKKNKTYITRSHCFIVSTGKIGFMNKSLRNMLCFADCRN